MGATARPCLSGGWEEDSRNSRVAAFPPRIQAQRSFPASPGAKQRTYFPGELSAPGRPALPLPALRARLRGGTGQVPAPGAPAQLTQPLSPRSRLPGRAGPTAAMSRPVRALCAGSQRPALGWQRLPRPPEPALQRGHPPGSTWATRGRLSRAPRRPSAPPRGAPPTRGLGWGVGGSGWGGSRAGSLLPEAGAGAGRGLGHRPPFVRGAEGWTPPHPSSVLPFPGWWRTGAARAASVRPEASHPLGARPWAVSGRPGSLNRWPYVARPVSGPRVM